LMRSYPLIHSDEEICSHILLRLTLANSNFIIMTVLSRYLEKG
jgi:hypothetical protein